MASLNPERLSEYFKRVGYKGSSAALQPNLQTLSTLQWHHVRSVPFENLSLRLEAAQNQHDVQVDIDKIFHKIVGSKRGGYCFEQNELFGAVLRGLGFDVLDCAARVVKVPSIDGADGVAMEEGRQPIEDASTKAATPAAGVDLLPHCHHFVLVNLEGRIWMADVAFGSQSLPIPLLLHEGAERYAPPPPDFSAADAYTGLDWVAELPVDRLKRYRLRLGVPGATATPDPATTPWFHSRAGYYLQRQSVKNGRWVDLYFFRLDEFLPQDYEQMNFALMTNPSSFFCTNTVVTRQTQEGRLTVENNSFRQWRDAEAAPVSEMHIEGEAQLLGILEQHYGIHI